MVVHTQDKAPVSHQLTEVKLLQALVVLWWGTTWEGKVMTTPARYGDTFLPRAMEEKREAPPFCRPDLELQKGAPLEAAS